MEKIYCLIVGGGVLTDKVRDSLFDLAQQMILSKDRKSRLRKTQHAAEGIISTTFKFGMISTIGGIMFKARFEVIETGRVIDCEFLVRPLTGEHHRSRGYWERVPLFPISEPDPTHN